MVSKESWKNEYNSGITIECPCCSKEGEHVCRDCYKDIDKQSCWDNDGYCKKCFVYIHTTIPEIETEKKRLGVKCECNNPICAKCLSVNCQDDNCPTHSLESKKKWRNK